MAKIEMLASPAAALFKHLNGIYDYDSSELKYIQKHLDVTIKQDSYMTTVEAMVRAGVISRAHKAYLIRLT